MVTEKPAPHSNRRVRAFAPEGLCADDLLVEMSQGPLAPSESQDIELARLRQVVRELFHNSATHSESGLGLGRVKTPAPAAAHTTRCRVRELCFLHFAEV